MHRWGVSPPPGQTAGASVARQAEHLLGQEGRAVELIAAVLIVECGTGGRRHCAAPPVEPPTATGRKLWSQKKSAHRAMSRLVHD